MTSLPQPLQAVVSLFEGPLSGVRFADIDAAGLTKLAADVSRVQVEVEAHEAKLVELKQYLAQRQEALQALAQQALAYARIYAEGDDALTAQLNDISLPRATKPRKAKAQPADAEVEAEAAPAAAVAATSEPVEAEAPAVEEDEADAPAKTKPAYARPKIKRKLARAGASSSA
jgi:hypothetical protein